MPSLRPSAGRSYYIDSYKYCYWHVGCYSLLMRESKSTCCYCGVGCGVLVASEGERITGVRGDPDHPANFGRLCTKGAALHRTLDPAARALHPELRTRRAAARERVSWNQALDYAADG